MIDAYTDFRIRSLEILVTKLASIVLDYVPDDQNPLDPDFVTRLAGRIQKVEEEDGA